MIRRRVRNRGLAIAITLIVLTIIVVMGFGLTTLGVQNLTFAHAERWSKAALFAAEGGANYGIRQLQANPAAAGDQPTYSSGMTTETLANVTIWNNLAGASPVQGPDGISIPARMAYLRSTGYTNDGNGRYRRVVGVMVKRRPGGMFDFALAAAGGIQLKGTDIYGPVKISGNLTTTSGVDVHAETVAGADVLVTGSLNNGSNRIRLVGSDAQDYEVLAKVSIQNESKVENYATVEAPSNSTKVLPWVADGRTVNDASGFPAGSRVLPNPIQSELLAGATNGTVGTIPGATVSNGTLLIPANFNLGNRTWVFNQPVRFDTMDVDTQGTIVVTGGHKLTLSKGLGSGSSDEQRQKVNLIALNGNGTTATSQIEFLTSQRIQGLVYAHGDISTQGNLDLKGTMISYGTGADQVHNGSHMDITLAPLAVEVAGFDTFFTNGASNRMQVMSWQRM